MQMARTIVEGDHIFMVPTVKPGLLDACIRAQQRVDSLLWMEDEAVIRTAAEAERTLFVAAGFTPHHDRDRCPWPTHDANGDELGPGTLMTTAHSEHSIWSPRDLPTSYYRIDGHFWLPDVRATFRHKQRHQYNVWADVAIRWAPEADPGLLPPVPLCALCEQVPAERLYTIGGIHVELCDDCRRPVDQAEVLLATETGELSRWGAASIRDGLGREADRLRGVMERLREIVQRRRSGAAGREPAIEPATRSLPS